MRIIGENIRSLNETNRALLSNILDTERPDFMLLNECAKLANERKQLLKDLNSINKRKDTELLKAIEFHYYSKSYTNKKAENKDDNKGIKLIKEFIETLYKEMTEERIKRK